jgi:peptidoglycan hydrolase-like protein with peptidoglycan-binding domain
MAVVVTGLAAYGIDIGDTEPTANAAPPPATDRVTRMTLTDTERVSGTLGYGSTHLAGAHGGAAGGTEGGGTVTWLPAAGAVIQRGQPVYRVDDVAVPLLYGSLPLYRTLRDGVDGTDVKQLEQNLAALGYTGFTVDTGYTAATASAVREWQSDRNVDETGTVAVGAAVIASGAIRVAELAAAVGDAAAGPVLSYTGTTRVVEVALDVSLQHLVRKGLSATVTLPNDSTVAGQVASVGTVATTSGGSGAGGQTETTIDVVVTVADQKALGTLDSAPVSVTLVSQTRRDVLTVPVAALVALAEGGYGVEVIADGHSSYVAVDTGLFANGRVEISGGGIVEGTVVGVPAS